MSETPVRQTKKDALTARLAALGVRAGDLAEEFILGSGRGGQKRNKTSSCVRLRHEPTGIEVKCDRARSRELNRFLARRELCDRLAARARGLSDARRQAAEKIRRQKRRRSRRARQRLLADKHHQAAKKERRHAPDRFE